MTQRSCLLASSDVRRRLPASHEVSAKNCAWKTRPWGNGTPGGSHGYTKHTAHRRSHVGTREAQGTYQAQGHA